MTRKFSSVSVETTLATGISNSATSLTVATGTATLLMGGVTLSAGNVDQFTIAIDPDTVNEEILFVTNVVSDTLTVVRARAGSGAIAHLGGATIKHVLTSDDLIYFNTGIDNAATLAGTQTLTNKTLALGSNTVTGTTAQFNTALTDNDFATQAGNETLTNKTLTAPTVTAPIVSYSVNAQTGTSYTAVASDAGAIITINNSSANTFNIPTNASVPFAIGTCLTVITTNAAAGTTGTQTTIQAVTSGTTTIAAAGASSTAPKLRTQYSSASAIKIGTDLWYVVGDLLQ